jgi:large subunit ribosomal protein L24
LAVALILALVAALVGPHFVDWNRYRSDFETEASRLVGAPVRISGPIEARLLPVPSLALHSVEISAGESAVSARALQFELALGPLMRRQWRVSELTVSEPRFRIALDSAGNLKGPPVKAEIESDRLSIDKLVIEGGRVVLADESTHSALNLNDFSFEGEMRSLTGPLRGEGFFIASDGPYRFRVSSGRRSDSGVRLRLSLEGVERPLQADADGVLQFDDSLPRFEGAITLARPAGAVLPSGRTLAREPWRLTMQVRVDPRRALAEQIEFQYGPEDRSLRLAGKADVVLGEHGHFKASLTGRQIDLDRLTGASETGRRAPAASIIAATRASFEATRVPMRGQVDLDIDAVTIGGAAVQSLRGTVGVDRDQWDIETIEFRAPGLTQVRMSGRLESSAKGLEFAGLASIDSADPRALWSFVEDAADMPRGAPVAPLQASGDLVIGDQGIVIDRLRAEIDHRRIEGRVAYAPTGAGGPARFDAALRADDIDLDRVIAVASSAFAGTKLERPHNVSLAISAGKLSYADIQASQVEARLKLDASGLTLERFSVADLQGANVKASGLIDVSSSSPHGAVSLALNATRADGLIGIAGRFAPDAAAEIRRYGSQLAPVELRVRLEMGPAQPAPPSSGRGAPASDARLTINGKFGAVRINLAAGGTGNVAALASTKVRIDGSIEADDGKVLAALVGFDRIAAIEARPAQISLGGNGPLDGDVAFDLRLAAGGLSASANGAARQDKGEWNGRANLSLSAADARVLLNASAPAALPLSVESRLAFAGRALIFDDVKSRVAGSAVDGKISLRLGSPLGVDGRVQATDLDAGKVIAALIGVPRRAAPREEDLGWSAEPFVRPLFDNVEGAISFQAARAGLLSGLAVNNLKGRARFDGTSLALDEVSGSLAGGAFTANAAFRTNPEGLSARARLGLVKGDLAQFTFGRNKPPASGGVSVVSEIDGSGRSPAALLGALAGNATVTLEKVEIPGLDPKAIEAAIQAADRGLASDRLSAYLGPALDAGRLVVPMATAALAISDGRVALVPIAVNADGVDLKFSGTLNLVDDNLNARVTLSGSPREDMKSRRPEVSILLNGSLPTAVREIDTADLISFVTLRAVERESKRVEAAEREAKKRREEAAAAERARAARDPAAPTPDPDQAVRGGQRATGTVSGTTGPAGSERAPDLPPAIDVKPRPAKPAAAAPAAKPLPPPSNRSLWDFFGRP